MPDVGPSSHSSGCAGTTVVISHKATLALGIIIILLGLLVFGTGLVTFIHGNVAGAGASASAVFVRIILFYFIACKTLFFFLNHNKEFVNQGYKTEKLFIAFNKLAHDKSLHPLCNTLSYILVLLFEITCNTIYILMNIYVHTEQHSKTFTFLLDNTVHYTRHYIMVSKFVLINIIIGYNK